MYVCMYVCINKKTLMISHKGFFLLISVSYLILMDVVTYSTRF